VYANFLSIFIQGKKSNEKSLAFFGEYAHTSPLCHFLALNNKAHKIANIYIYIYSETEATKSVQRIGQEMKFCGGGDGRRALTRRRKCPGRFESSP